MDLCDCGAAPSIVDDGQPFCRTCWQAMMAEATEAVSRHEAALEYNQLPPSARRRLDAERREVGW